MNHYTQLTREERYQISTLKTAGYIQVEIAKVIGRHKSIVSQELARNRGLRGYRPRQANGFAENCSQAKIVHRISSVSWARVSDFYSNTEFPVTE